MRISQKSNEIKCKNECSKYVCGTIYELIKDLNSYNLQCYINNEKNINLYEDFKYKKKKKIEFMSIVDYYGGLKNNEYEFFIIPIIFNKHNEILYMGVSIFFKNEFFEEYKINNYNYIELFIYNVKNEKTNNNFYPHMDINQDTTKKNTFLNFLVNIDDLNKNHRQTNNHLQINKNKFTDKNIYDSDGHHYCSDVYNMCNKNIYGHDDIINICDKNVCDKNVCDKNICDKNVCDKNVCDENICDKNICDKHNINSLVPNMNIKCKYNLSNYLYSEKISGDYKKIQCPLKIDDHYILCSDGVVKLKSEENDESANDKKKIPLSSIYETCSHSSIQGTTRKNEIQNNNDNNNNNNDNIYKGHTNTDNHHNMGKEEAINKCENYKYSYTSNEINKVYKNIDNKENYKKDDSCSGSSLVKYNEQIYHANISIQRKEMTMDTLKKTKMEDNNNKSINHDDNKNINHDDNKSINHDDNNKSINQDDNNKSINHDDNNKSINHDDNKNINDANSINTHCSYKYSATYSNEKVEYNNVISEEIKIKSPKKDEESIKINNMFKCGFYSFKGNRTYNEDRVIIIENMNNFLKEEYDTLIKKASNEYELIDKEYMNIIHNIKDMETPSYIYCAIYDGHNGDNAVNIVQKILHIHMYYYFINGNGLENSLKYSFQETDNYICKNIINIKEDNHSNYSSGTTACVSVIFKNMLYVANIGDSRCIISKNGRAIVLTVDHRASINKKEQQRIINSGGILDDEGYLGGCLGVCRGFGSFHKNTKEKLKGLICEPDLFHIKLTDDDEFLIICCDGIFDVITSQEAVNTVKNSLIQSRDANTAAEALCQLAYKKKSLDNLSVLVVIFQNPHMNKKVSSINESSGIYSGQAGRVRRRIKFSALKDLINQ
ncbi:protein phosphatase PPM1, putative [Plasmodium sp. gorilla clade G2]|uniref:protein phosphatase PPM1, putative n=1 Tax=Plasmodium sp. gorilla clade G2 TaxID=880535 RepID=UPI000D2227DA|nr:protein phosphatase PPM1, putative [Plasmodium sp. gorilla clade G2]SOV11299.1 protein phosphatase PPM1, putative [Plasmodium sp. gorilla clade G2]